jgi:hypothetical protein
MQNLTIGNPPVFQDNNPLFRCGEIRVALEAATLKSDLVRLNSVHLEDVEVGFIGGKSGSNLQALAQRVAERSEKSTDSTQDGRRIYVGSLVVSNVWLRLDLPGVLKDIKLPLGDFNFREIGGKNGAAPGEITRVVSAALAKRAQTVVVTSLPQTAVELGLAPEKLAEMLGLPVPAPVQKAADFLRGIF